MSDQFIRIESQNNHFPALKTVCLIVILFGCLLRFFEITQNSFIFYDEGMYLNHNRELLWKIEQFPAKDGAEFFAIFKVLFLTALATAKWLWFFISNLRVFVDGPEMFYFNRVVSALFGVLTVGLTYVFARRSLRSKEIALLSAAILAVLPSHVFYSRLAMQESFSAFFMLLGMFLYSSRRNMSVFVLGAAMAFSAVYFTNYRMIILPVLLAGFELVGSLCEKRPFGWKKFGLTVVLFFGIIIGIGLINNASNLSITTAWMGHQAGMASIGFHPLDLLSYPYTIFRLEGLLFGSLLTVSLYWLMIRDWSKFLPAVLVLLQMLIFTFASEKGARYLCVVLPFAAIAAALNVHALILNNNRLRSWAPLVLCSLLLFSLVVKSVSLVGTPQGYAKAVRLIKDIDPQAKILSTQPLVMNLWVDQPEDILPVAKNIPELIMQYRQGFRYLVLDPQAYISWTSSGQRFTAPLVDYLGFIRGQMPPLAKVPHLNQALLERFVFDHNEHLDNSIRFLEQKDGDSGAVYLYDLTQSLAVMQKVIELTSAKTGTP